MSCNIGIREVTVSDRGQTNWGARDYTLRPAPVPVHSGSPQELARHLLFPDFDEQSTAFQGRVFSVLWTRKYYMTHTHTHPPPHTHPTYFLKILFEMHVIWFELKNHCAFQQSTWRIKLISILAYTFYNKRTKTAKIVQYFLSAVWVIFQNIY